MATTSKFLFSATDQTSKAFNSIKKSLKQLTVQTVALTTAMRALGAAVKAATNALTSILGAALKGIVNLVKGALSTIKKLITSAFRFIKSALSTLLSWIVKALGKVFDWMKNTLSSVFNGMTKIAHKAVQAAKKAIDTIIESVQAYSDKQYNEIQLRVSLGDSYDSVMKSFSSLLKYTTADKNDLLSIFATYAEVGKKPEEIEKYARATVYLANATGRSLTQITRLLLGQEAASKDLETVMHRIGIDVSTQEDSLSNVEKIISQLDDEMQEISRSSLSQMFANVKNDVITIKEQIGYIFSGPVKYITQKLDTFLTRIAKSNKIKDLATAIDNLFDKIKPTIDKIFDFFEKFIQDPGGFFKALWEDIQTIFSNLWNNFGEYLSIAGYIIGQAVQEIGSVFGSIDWTGLKEALNTIGTGLSDFVINIGFGAGLIDFEDIVSGSITKTFINAWNKAVPDFQLSADDPWYKNLTTLLKAAWEGIKTLWDEWGIGEKLTSLWDSFKDVFTNKVLPTLVSAFQYLGQVLGVAINNAIASSDTIRKVLNIIPGVNFGSQEELAEKQASLYAKTKDLLPAGWTASDLTKENLLNYKVGNSTLMAQLFKYATEEIAWIRKTDILGTKEYPSFAEFTNGIKDIWAPVTESLDDVLTTNAEVNGAIVDASRDFREIDKAVVSIANTIGHGGTGFSMGGGGGISDYYGDNEFRIKPYAKGGMVMEPTLALIGEDGPEVVISNKDLTQGKGSFDWSNPWGSAKAALGITKDLHLITKDTSAIAEWWDKTDGLETSVEKGVEIVERHIMLPWYKNLWNGIKQLGQAIGKAFPKYVSGTMSLLAQNGAFGSHIGNIVSGIKSQADNNTLTLWSALGEIIKEFLPYLQKGLEVVGSIFDEAFEILGHAVQILGERIGKVLLPLLEAFIPFMKTLADIVIALSPILESVIKPALLVIGLILNALTGILDKLMPVFAALGAVIQWVCDAVSYVVGSFINWLASWIPSIQKQNVSKPKHVADYYWETMDAYNASKANSATGISTQSVGMASQTASYSGSTTIHITNDFSGSYVVGNGGFRELALIIKNTLEDVDYYGQSV